jgi:hypothetical protein
MAFAGAWAAVWVVAGFMGVGVQAQRSWKGQAKSFKALVGVNLH